MTPGAVRANALRWADDAFPGWVEVSLVDSIGRDHRIVEKVPVLTTQGIRAANTFPMELWLDVQVDRLDAGTATVTLQHGVETVDGAQRITVTSADVRMT
ncbi:hypothetical protein [Micromonospora globispora]|nr:hypothetical protein [Micromonospora globispora]